MRVLPQLALTQGAAAPQPQHKLPGWEEAAASMARLKEKVGTEAEGGVQDFILIESLITGLKHIIAASKPEQAGDGRQRAAAAASENSALERLVSGPGRA